MVGAACRLASLFFPLAAAGRPSAEAPAAAPAASSAANSSTPPPPFSSSIDLDLGEEEPPFFFFPALACRCRFWSFCAEATMADVLPPEVCVGCKRSDQERAGVREREQYFWGRELPLTANPAPRVRREQYFWGRELQRNPTPGHHQQKLQQPQQQQLCKPRRDGDDVR
jgi:hypothetical protein